MKKINTKTLKRLRICILLDAIQIALLIFIMVYSQMLVLHGMVMLYGENAHKGTLGACFSSVLSAAIYITILWMILFHLDKYKEFFFGDSFLPFWEKRKSATEVLRDGIKNIPPPPPPFAKENLWHRITPDMDFSEINWKGCVLLCTDDGEIILTCGNCDLWVNNLPEVLLGDDAPAFKDCVDYELSEPGKKSLLSFAVGYLNLPLDIEGNFRQYATVPQMWSFDNKGHLCTFQQVNMMFVYVNGFIKVVSYHQFVKEGDDLYRTISEVEVTHQDCNWSCSLDELKKGVRLKYIINLDTCPLTDSSILF